MATETAGNSLAPEHMAAEQARWSRLEALRLAISNGEPPDEAVRRAAAYLAFIEGRTTEAA